MHCTGSSIRTAGPLGSFRPFGSLAPFTTASVFAIFATTSVSATGAIVVVFFSLLALCARGSQRMAMPSGDVDDDPIGLQPTSVVDLALDPDERVDVQSRHAFGRMPDFDRRSRQSEVGTGLAGRRKSLDRDAVRSSIECRGILEPRGFERACLGVPSPADSQALSIAARPRPEGGAGSADIGRASSQVSDDRRHDGLFACRSASCWSWECCRPTPFRARTRSRPPADPGGSNRSETAEPMECMTPPCTRLARVTGIPHSTQLARRSLSTRAVAMNCCASQRPVSAVASEVRPLRLPPAHRFQSSRCRPPRIFRFSRSSNRES